LISSGREQKTVLARWTLDRLALPASSLSAACTFSLDANDKRNMVNLFSPPEFDLPAKRILRQRMDAINLLDTFELGLQWSPE
jgi:hypothetical protein